MPQTSRYRQPRRHILRYTLWAVTALLAVAAFGIATPYVFLVVGRIHPRDWVQFSNEGQAYGGIAAVIGMLAIVGVVTSLIFQTRESAANRVQMERVFHADLLKMAFEEPELIECWGTPPGDITKMKQVAYVNLIASFWFAMFEIGRVSEAELSRWAAEMFAGSPARTYWPGARNSWIQAALGRANRRFIAIVDEEYQRAVASGPAIRWPEREALAPKTVDNRSTIKSLVLGTVCGMAIAGVTTAIRRHRLL